MRCLAATAACVAALSLSACGGHAPELSEMSSVEQEVRRNREFFVTAMVEDKLRDLAGGTIYVKVESQDGGSVEAETPLLAQPGDQHFEVLAGITLGFTLSPSNITVEMSVSDGAGERSNTQSLGLQLIR